MTRTAGLPTFHRVDMVSTKSRSDVPRMDRAVRVPTKPTSVATLIRPADMVSGESISFATRFARVDLVNIAFTGILLIVGVAVAVYSFLS